MCVPSGDQIGLNGVPAPCRMTRTPVPSAFATYSARLMFDPTGEGHLPPIAGEAEVGVCQWVVLGDQARRRRVDRQPPRFKSAGAQVDLDHNRATVARPRRARPGHSRVAVRQGERCVQRAVNPVDADPRGVDPGLQLLAVRRPRCILANVRNGCHQPTFAIDDVARPSAVHRSRERTARWGPRSNPWRWTACKVRWGGRLPGSRVAAGWLRPPLPDTRRCRAEYTRRPPSPGRSSARLPIIRAVVATRSARSRSTTAHKGTSAGRVIRPVPAAGGASVTQRLPSLASSAGRGCRPAVGANARSSSPSTIGACASLSSQEARSASNGSRGVMRSTPPLGPASGRRLRARLATRPWLGSDET